jgi:hypothetical protein
MIFMELRERRSEPDTFALVLQHISQREAFDIPRASGSRTQSLCGDSIVSISVTRELVIRADETRSQTKRSQSDEASGSWITAGFTIGPTAHRLLY